jgi:hypothetical protein
MAWTSGKVMPVKVVVMSTDTGLSARRCKDGPASVKVGPCMCNQNEWVGCGEHEARCTSGVWFVHLWKVHPCLVLGAG